MAKEWGVNNAQECQWMMWYLLRLSERQNWITSRINQKPDVGDGVGLWISGVYGWTGRLSARVEFTEYELVYLFTYLLPYLLHGAESFLRT